MKSLKFLKTMLYRIASLCNLTSAPCPGAGHSCWDLFVCTLIASIVLHIVKLNGGGNS